MEKSSTLDEQQAALWNGSAGHAWATMQEVLDGMFQPFEAMLIEAACRDPANRVLDVGCGAGATTRALARQLGTDGGCVGIAVSAPLVALARARAQQEGSSARFICADACADAGIHAFEPASFDAIVSRFGVMFFADPVAAFSRLRRAARPGATWRAVVWRSAEDNPFMTVAERAATPLLPGLTVRQPGLPGQFALADRRHVAGVMEQSGWREVDIQPVDVPCVFAERDLLAYLTQLGPLARLLPQLDEATRTHVVRVVREAFEPFVHGVDVRFTAACWRIDARAAGGTGDLP